MSPSPPLGYEAWIVDFDGTLYRQRYVRLAMACELLLGNWRSIRPLQAFRREQEQLRLELIEAVESPYALQLERAARRLAIPDQELERIVSDWMIARPGRWLRRFRRRDLLSQIEAFRQQGGRAALVSDYPASAKLAALGARDLFEVVVASGEPGGPGRLKPFPDGFLLAAEALGVAPSHCLVIGDRPDVDGAAAAKAGMAFHRV